MRVLFFIHALSGGGAERQLSFLSAELVKSGVDLKVVYRDLGPLGEKALVKGVSYDRLDIEGNYNFRILPQVYKIIREYRPQIVQSWINQFDIIVGLVHKLIDFTWVSREANAGWNHSGFKNKYLREWLLRDADCVVANSPTGFDYWAKIKKTRLILNGFVKSNELAASEPQYKKNSYILYVGRLVKHKNVDKLIESFANIRASEKCKLVICGVGNQEGLLKNVARNMGVDEAVDFLGFLPKERIEALMAHARGLCLLSDYEGMPNVVYEAMLHDIPVLLSSTKSHRALFDDDTVMYSSVDVPGDLDKKLKELVFQGGGRDMIDNASAHVKSLSVDNMKEKYLKLYTDLLGES